MIELNIAGKAVALILGRRRVRLEPGSSKGLFPENFIPVIDEHLDQLALDVGLLVSVSSDPSRHCGIHFYTTRAGEVACESHSSAFNSKVTNV